VLGGALADQLLHAHAQRHVGFLKGLQLLRRWLVFLEK
jgi:hypothetical protein